MGSKSSSSSANTSENTTFNNVDYGGDTVGSNSQLLGKNVNLSKSELSLGDVNVRTTVTDFGAIEQGAEVAKRAIESSEYLTSSLFDTGESLFRRSFEDVEDSREFTADIAQRFIDETADSNKTALQFVGQTLDRSLAAANQFTKTENAQLLEQIAKYGAYGVIGLGAVWLGSAALRARG